MEELSIAEDVELLAKGAHLNDYIHSKCDTFIYETICFLSTIAYYTNTGVPNPEYVSKTGGGHITFRVNGTPYSCSLKEISELFNFPLGTPVLADVSGLEKDAVWKVLTGIPVFKSARAKGNMIRNPCVNYFRRAIAETYYSRETTGTVNLGEIELLIAALKSTVGTLSDGTKLRGDTENSSLAYVLCAHLTGYKKRAKTLAEKGKQRKIAIGGPVCKIMEHCGVPLIHGPNIGTRTMDIRYLRRTEILSKKMHEGKVIYRFPYPGIDSAQITLPCPEHSSIKEKGNINFLPPHQALIGYNNQPDQPEEEEEDSDPEQLFFEEYNPRGLTGHSKVAHQRIHKLLKINKWLVRKVRKLVAKSEKWKVMRKKARAKNREMKKQIEDLLKRVQDLETRSQGDQTTHSKKKSKKKSKKPATEQQREQEQENHDSRDSLDWNLPESDDIPHDRAYRMQVISPAWSAQWIPPP